MTVHIRTNKEQYVGNGVSASFPVRDAAHVRVYQTTAGGGDLELTSGFQVVLNADDTCSVVDVRPAGAQVVAEARPLVQRAEDAARNSSDSASQARGFRDEAESIVGVGFAGVGKPGLVAPDGVTTLVDPESGELYVEVGLGVTFDGVTIRQDEESGDHYVPVASVTQPGALIQLVVDQTGIVPDSILGSYLDADRVRRQLLFPAAMGSGGQIGYEDIFVTTSGDVPLTPGFWEYWAVGGGGGWYNDNTLAAV